MGFCLGASSLYLLLVIAVLVTIGMEAVEPIGVAALVPTAIDTALYIVCQHLQVSFTNEYNCASAAPILCCMLQEGFGLSSSPGLRGRGAGQDVILPVV